MSTVIKLRRSAIAGRVPTTSQLELGEIAINTTDGKLYFKKYDPVANTESIIDVSADLNPQAVLDLLKTVDGAGSGLDSDLLDGQEGTYYLDFTNFTNLPDPVLNVTGDVEGNTTFTDLGNASLNLELTNTGVTPGSYGSASLVPIITVDEDGRITSANTTSVAGVSEVYWDSANNTFTIETADGGIFHTVVETFTDITINDLFANNIIVDGLVDGRDIAADGAKLDLLEDGLDLTLTGKVTGTATSNTGVMTLSTELANTGVTPGVYGSPTQIPVFTVDEDGRLTTANTSPVAGVDDFTYAAANNTITLQTGDGSVFNIQTETEVTLSGKVTGTATATDGNLSIVTELANTGVTPDTYGSSTSIPVLTIDEDGRITLASSASVAGVNDFYWTSANNTLSLETGDGSSYLVPIEDFNDISANNITVLGTVNGRDIADDGLKLDGIEPGATADQTATEILNLLLTVDGDGSGIDADSVDGYSASEILDAAANNAASLIGAGDVTVLANTGVLVSGDSFFNLNSANNHTIVIEHSDTSSVADISLSLPNVLTGLTFDTFGHVQTTSSTNLDDRYYTETEADNKFVDVAGDIMTGDLEVQGNIIQNESRFISTSVTTSSTSTASIYSFPHGTYGSAEVTIQVTQGSNRHITKLLITHDGSTPIATEYGTVYTSGELASFDLSFFGPALQLDATPASASSTTFKIVGTLIDA